MLNITLKVLALNFLSLTCFAADDKPIEEKFPVSSSQENSCKKELIESDVIHEELPPSSPHQFQDLNSPHKPIKTPKPKTIRQKAWEDALGGDQIALTVLVSKHWYTQKQLLQLTELIVTMALQENPAAKEILCDFSRKFRCDEVIKILNSVVHGVELENETASKILLAFIHHSSLAAFAPPTHNETILSFLTEKAYDKDTVDFISQVKLLEAYRDGHYGIKKNYKKNKRLGYNLMTQFALEANNPYAQAFMLMAYKEGDFGIKKNDQRRKKEARIYLSQFATTTAKTSPAVNLIIQKALSEGWFDLVPITSIIEDGESSSSTITTVQRKEAFFNSLLQSATKTVYASLQKADHPMHALKSNLKKIVRCGFDDINNGFNKNNRLALLVLKSLAVDYNYFPAQTLLIHAYHDGLFGIKLRNRSLEGEALNYIKRFAPHNYSVQMLQLEALTNGWFNIDPTDWKVQSHALFLAEDYAYQGNRRAQEFLIDVYVHGYLGTRKQKERHQKAAFYRKKFGIYPESPEQPRVNYFAIIFETE